MRNLLSAGFVRLWRSKMLWLSCLFVAGIAVISIWTRYSEGIEYGYRSSLDSAFLNNIVFMAFLIPVICTLLIGTEYADGTMRNKLVCGHHRGSVYLCNLILCCVASLVLCTSAMVPGICVGLPLLGGFEMGRTRAILFFAGVYTLSLAWTALLTFLTMLISNHRTISAVAPMFLSLTLLVAGTYLDGRLQSEPTIHGHTLSVDGEIVRTEEDIPNPSYIPEGPVRDVLQFLSDFSPGGQTVQHVSQAVAQPVKLMIYDAALFVIATGAGLALFRRKDLK